MRNSEKTFQAKRKVLKKTQQKVIPENIFIT